MRVVGVVIATLMTLGLAAFGVVAAQKAAGPSSLIALAAHVVSPSQNSGTAAHPAPANQVASARVVQSPVTEIGQAAAPAANTNAASVASIVVAQNTAAPASVAPTAPAASSGAATPPPAPKSASASCANPDAFSVSRVVEIDTTGGPAFGTEHFKQYDFLRDKEVVLTFDDGPWPENTPAVLKALQDNCAKATFFEIGEHATWRPDLTKELVAAGMTVGTHTWSHKDLAKNPYAKDIEQAKQEIEMGVSAVHMAAAGGPVAPFFRFPDLQQPAELMTYLGTRNIATFSTDIDTFDFKLHKPDDVIKSALTKLAKNGKGIVLMHDFQHGTAEAMPELLRQLKANGYKLVHMVPKEPVTTLAKYDDMVRAQDKFSATNNTRPESSVVKTISE
ncbi:MAG TPA: polysaccharide deacetylase family protein [Xanthobacteraceae bacterium]